MRRFVALKLLLRRRAGALEPLGRQGTHLYLVPRAKSALHYGVRLGIRAQLLLWLGALLLFAFVPLYFAVASVTRASLTKAWGRSALLLGRSVAGHISAAMDGRDPPAIRSLLQAQLGQGVAALAVFDKQGDRSLAVGDRGAIKALPQKIEREREMNARVFTARGEGILVLVPATDAAVGVLIYTDPQAIGVAPVLRLVALYTGLLGMGLLIFAYLVLTRVVVTPLDKLRVAASRVAASDQELVVGHGGSSELVELGSSLKTMYAKLQAEKTKLSQKVAELKDTAEELSSAQDTVVRSERLASVGRLAAGLAHEIGNPIAAILAFQELLADSENLSEDERDFVARMTRETERVHRILRDLLDFARPAAGVPNSTRAADLNASPTEAVEHVVQLLQPQKAFHGVALDVVLLPGLPAVKMAPERLEQVLLNLLLNAADAASDQNGKVRVTSRFDDETVCLAISDNGPGIDPSIADTLFEPFVTTKDVGKGTGLGLAVCRGLVEAIGGSLGVDAEPSALGGACFTLVLPRIDSAS